MKSYEKAFYYVTRKRGKSFLLALIFGVALLMILLGMTLLLVFEESLSTIGKQSKSKITVFHSKGERYFTDSELSKLAEHENIYFTNRNNETTSKVQNLELSVRADEDISLAQAKIQGFDDFTLDSLYAQGIVVLEEGSLPVEKNDLNIYEPLALVNHLKIGDEIIFQNMNDEKTVAVIRGFYNYTNPDLENEKNALSAYRYENLIFSQTEFVNQIQGEQKYIEGHFYVSDPNKIQQTRQDFEKILGSNEITTWVSDILFRKMNAALLQTASIIKMILVITSVTSIIIISLLLLLWAKERKKEIALILSIGGSKVSIINQRLLEVLFIYLISWIVVLPLSFWLSPWLGKIVYNQELQGIVEINIRAVSLPIIDIAQIFLLGAILLGIVVKGSCISTMCFTPRAILASME